MPCTVAHALAPPGRTAHRSRGRTLGGRSTLGERSLLGERSTRGELSDLGQDVLRPAEDVARQCDGARREGHDVDACPEVRSELGEERTVRVRAQVDEGRDDVPPTRVRLLQGTDRVERRPAGGDLVVDEHDRVGVVEEARVLRQQEVLRGVRVLLGEAGGGRDARDRTPRRVQGRHVERRGHAVTEGGRRLGIPDDDRRRPGLVGGGPQRLDHVEERRRGDPVVGGERGTQRVGHAGRPRARRDGLDARERVRDEEAEEQACAVDDPRVSGHVLAEHRRDEEVRTAGVAPDREADELVELDADARPDSPHAHAEPLRHPGSRPRGRCVDRQRAHAIPLALSTST